MTQVEPTELEGVLLIGVAAFKDDRGFFCEMWNQKRYQEAGLPEQFVQDNLSWSKRGVLRGLHFQQPTAQGKLVSVLSGEIFDVAVDIRKGSRTFGKWCARTLSSDNRNQLYVPEGFAHGFQVLSETALVHYKCTAPYQPKHEHCIRWDDPGLSVEWPLDSPVVSGKDQAGSLISNAPEEWFPKIPG